MTNFGSERVKDEVLLIARILLALLFLTFGWSKLADYSGTVAYMTQTGLPLPAVAAVVAIVIEFFGAIALMAWHLDTPSGGVARILHAGKRLHWSPLLDPPGSRSLWEHGQLL